MHHILIGPDHLLFLVGLLLLGGTLRQLLLVVTAFTIAHSITLSLAALGMVIPPANAIEPAIALSIVYVGADNLLVSAGGRDTRAWIAFAFGLIHGFGFANVLREMDLPGRALGWTLFAFNVGVEIGQLVFVVLVASLFIWIRSRSEAAGRRLVFAGSIIVMLAGAFWFVQRVFFSGGVDMKRIVVLTALIAAGAVSYVVAQQGGQKPMVVEVEKLKDNLFVLTGGGGNTTVFVQSNGITVVDTKNPGWGAPILAKIQELSPCADVHHGHAAAARQRRAEGALSAAASPRASCGCRRSA